jgi:hypothetical protein
MKITYAQNPLCSVVELDERERNLLWHKIKLEEYQELLFSAHFRLTEGEHFDLAAARAELDPAYWCTDGKSKLDERVDEIGAHYIEELKGGHCGDCICVACSCAKCHAEHLLGIDTIKGLRKHSGPQIAGAFGTQRQTCAEAIAWLEGNPPSKTCKEAWHAPHIARWAQEQLAAIAWLKHYHSTILKGD